MTKLLFVIGIIFLGVMMTREITKKRHVSMSAETDHWMLAANPIELDHVDTHRKLSNHPKFEFSRVLPTFTLSECCNIFWTSLPHSELELN